MSTATLPASANLEYYRKRAKALVRSVLSADPDAIARVRELLPRYVSGDPFLLSDAQWVLAREHGFNNWAKLKVAVEEQARPAADLDPKPREAAASESAAQSYEPGLKTVKEKTGKSWDEWFAALDSEGCATKTHKEIVAVAHKHGAGSWWQQMVTVEYERARGLRVKFQGCDGDVRTNASKTISAPAEAVFYAWAHPEKRELWLPGSGLTIRKATCPKSVRITWSDGTNVDVVITPKGDAKCSCAVEHSRLSGIDRVEPLKAFWAEALGKLKELAEA